MTLRTQWQTAFVKKPQWVFVTGWNEHIAQVIAAHRWLAHSQGLKDAHAMPPHPGGSWRSAEEHSSGTYQRCVSRPCRGLVLIC